MRCFCDADESEVSFVVDGDGFGWHGGFAVCGLDFDECGVSCHLSGGYDLVFTDENSDATDGDGSFFFPGL